MDVWAGVGIVVLLGGSMAGLALMARRVRRRGSAGPAVAAAMAAFDEGFHSTAHDTFVELRTQDERGQHTHADRRRADADGLEQQE
ncbi:hypothetical protein [Microbacterium sp. No. 7]|uniref:hypothetical protein n=1 Tax=Microbacterium sp. No. 7 TaxID=1714373 RepID=UPI0006CFA6BA|nr:hypothetical protein [Microbacterium sp. No. 7]